jgi:hypothetical protein
MRRTGTLLFTALAICCPAPAGTALAQTRYPEKPG